MSPRPAPLRRPDWLKVSLDTGEDYRALKRLVGEQALHTVCEEARCPNLHECWNARSATFMILGDTCTRHCGFCSVGKGRPLAPDADEPRRVAAAVRAMGCRHAVLTSVDRDDLPDLGAGHWAATLRAVRAASPGITIETLIPDFQGRRDCLAAVMAERPEVLSHNVETVPERYKPVRHDSSWTRSLAVLAMAREWQPAYAVGIKSGMMLGLGETREQLLAAMDELLAAGCEILTLGQYLSPTRSHLPVQRFVPPDEFAELKAIGEAMGFKHVEAGPFVRSSYMAHKHVGL
ncbi:lipoyl synthase [bacterium]|nr:lipoyl synthase [bacterium]